MTIEQIVLEKFRALSSEKQQKVLDFIKLLEQETIAPLTKEEQSKADELIARGLARAQITPLRSAESIWTEFEAVRSRIAAKMADSETTKSND